MNDCDHTGGSADESNRRLSGGRNRSPSFVKETRQFGFYEKFSFLSLIGTAILVAVGDRGGKLMTRQVRCSYRPIATGKFF